MIGGNITATLQEKTTTKNAIGGTETTWLDVQSFVGFLDFIGGGSGVDTYNAKIKESTHVFIMDYEEITKTESETRLMVDGEPYEITLIDDPMYLHEHVEIYLKYTG